MLLTISGLPGSGKSTVGRLLAKKLRLPYYSIGAMRRSMARERGLTLEELNAIGERQEFTDTMVDQWQAGRAKKTKRGIFEGRTSFYFIPQSVKIFLSVKPRVAAKRILRDGSHVRTFESGHGLRSLDSVTAALRRRIASDTRRYKRFYGLNILLRKHYDIYLDTSRETPVQTAKRILKKIKISTVPRPANKKMAKNKQKSNS